MTRRRENGFTLVEMLVSLALIALIATYLVGGLRQSARTGELADELDAAAGIDAVRAFLANALAGAVPAIDIRGGRAVLAFTGGPERLAFVAPADPRLERGGLYRTEIGMENGAVRLQRRLFRAGDDDGTAQRRRIDGLGDLRLRYWGAKGEGEPRWHETWRDTQRLPRLVEIRAEPANRRAAWPPLTVRLLQAAP